MRYIDSNLPNGQSVTVNVYRKEWMQIIVNESSSVLLGSQFKVFKDLSIEMPFSFKDEEFDEFLVEVGKRGIYQYNSVPSLFGDKA